MALEGFGEETANLVDKATTACHDLVKTVCDTGISIDTVNFRAGEEGVWAVYPSMLDGKPAVEIRLAVG